MTMKTPEELAKLYANEECTGNAIYGDGLYVGFLAGYQAAQHKDKAVNRTHLAWKLAKDYGAVKWLKHKDYKRFGNTDRDYEYTIARDGFYQGYQAARDQVADANKVMNSSNNSNGWISVKDRLPGSKDGVTQLWMKGRSLADLVLGCHAVMTDKGEMVEGVLDMNKPDGIWDMSDFTHWMPLPKPPEEK